MLMVSDSPSPGKDRTDGEKEGQNKQEPNLGSHLQALPLTLIVTVTLTDGERESCVERVLVTLCVFVALRTFVCDTDDVSDSDDVNEFEREECGVDDAVVQIV